MLRGTRLLTGDQARLFVRTADALRGFLHR
jgi:hypothetical protein